MIKNCYIHIPFCKKICSYCDFCKMYYKEELVDKYLDVLEQEIDSIYKNEELETIYIGGGTPSCLNIRQLERLFIILGKLNKTKNIEYTIEGNFSSTTKEKLLLYKKYGINRLSLGIESINKNNLDIEVVGGRYGISSKNTNVNDILSVYDNLSQSNLI